MRIGVGDDAGASAEAQLRAFQFGAADQDVEVEVAVAVEPAERAGVGAAPGSLEFGDDLHAAHLRAAGDGAAGKHRGDRRARRRVRAQAAAHVADDVVHVRVAFHRHQLVHLDAAGHAHAAEVVAFEVDQHHVFGAFLGVADQVADARRVVVAVEARARAGDGPGLDHGLPVLDPGSPRTDTSRSGEALTTAKPSPANTPANGAGLWVRRRWNSSAGCGARANRAFQPRLMLAWNTSPAAR